MSLVTRCPACSTMFKVVPDQIRIAAGWVRCGHCNEVFHAPTHMLPYEQLPRASEPPPQVTPPPNDEPITHAGWPAAAPTPAPAAMPDAAADRSAEDSVPDLLSEFMTYEDDAIVASRQGFEDTAPSRTVAEQGAAASAPNQPARVRFDFSMLDSQLAADSSAWSGLDAAGKRAAPDSRLGGIERQPAKRQAPSFVAEAERRAFWSSRPIRALLWLGSLLLLLGLVLQVALSLRDGLAARIPQLTPALQALCAPLACRVQPYRHLDAIIIDSSAFNRVDTSSFRFSVTLRNASDVPVASPALELTLTDAQDQPLVRRVVTADELGAPPTLAARGEFSGISALTVSDASNPGAIASYRLLAFYP